MHRARAADCEGERARRGGQVLSGAWDGAWSDVTAVLHWHVDHAIAAAAHSPGLTMCTASLRPPLVGPAPPARR